MEDAVRYDAVADWYIDFSQDWVPHMLLPEDIAGHRVLDLACAWGTASRDLARRGAHVHGVDLADGMLSRARALETEEPLGIVYLQGDATTTEWWNGTPYDGVVANMSLMDIDDLVGAVRTVATVLRPGGWFSFSVIHPCFPGRPDGSPPVLSSWPPDGGYQQEGWWNTRGDGVRGRVGSNHRMLSTYFNTVLAAGLAIEEVADQPGTCATRPEATVPTTLIVRCRRT